MSSSDYYKLLGIARDASADDIQKAFRQLARKFHPDVNKAPGAEDKFKQINEAHEVIDQHVARGLERVITHFEEQPTKAKKAK